MSKLIFPAISLAMSFSTAQAEDVTLTPTKVILTESAAGMSFRPAITPNSVILTSTLLGKQSSRTVSCDDVTALDAGYKDQATAKSLRTKLEHAMRTEAKDIIANSGGYVPMSVKGKVPADGALERVIESATQRMTTATISTVGEAAAACARNFTPR